MGAGLDGNLHHIILWGGAAGAVLTIVKFWKRIWPTVKGAFTMIARLQRVENHVGQINTKLDSILKELQPNGGSTIKDTVTRIDNALTVNVERQRVFNNDSMNGLMETDAEGNCVWANSTYLGIVGRTIESVLGKGWVNTIQASERDRVMTEWDDALEEDREFEYEYHVVTTRGERKMVRIRSMKLRDSNGTTVGYIKTVTPVNQR